MKYSQKIARSNRPNCPCCGKGGKDLYGNLDDGLYMTSGGWGFKRCEEPECRLVWLDPCPLVEELPKLYLKYPTHLAPDSEKVRGLRILREIRNVADKGAASRSTGPVRVFGWIAKQLLKCVPGGLDEYEGRRMFLPASGSGKMVLEVGCGDGAALLHLSSLGWNVVGIEPDPTSRAIAVSHGLKIYSEISELPKEPKVDAVVMHHVIEHIFEPKVTLEKLRLHLADGADVVLITPNVDSRMHARFGKAWYPLDPPRHLQLYNTTSIKNLLQSAGFTNVRAYGSVKGMRSYYARSIDLERDGLTDPNGPQTIVTRIYSSIAQYWLRTFGNDREYGDELIAMGQYVADKRKV